MRKFLLVLSLGVVPFTLSSCAGIRSVIPSSSNRDIGCHSVTGIHGVTGSHGVSISRTAPGVDGPVVATEPLVQLPEPEWEVTPEVEFELRRMLGRERYFFARSLERRDKFLTMAEQVFRDEGVPLSLITLALIESGFDPNARSYAGAVGMWQFMRNTAKAYGLRVDRRADDRRDPILSTIAAARHLKDLYETYYDWNLALAAYNAGAGGISRAMQRAGVEDYWSLVRRKKIKLQTARYVPRIIAASIIIKNLAKYDLSTMAGNFDWLQEEKDGAAKDVSVEVARWSGNRRPSAS